MNLKIIDNTGKETGSVQLPDQFEEAFRPDLIKRIVLSLQSKLRQPYGSKKDAGMRHSAELSRRRKKYRGSYGFGISRVPRKILSGRGTRFNWVGAVSPGTVGGRRAHPPKVEKIWAKNMNKKEADKAMRSALHATLDSDVVKERGHALPKTYPFVFSKNIESITKTKDLQKALEAAGLQEELARTQKKTIRPGKGKSRGRKYKKKVGPLLVVSDESKVKNIKTLPGVEITDIHTLNAQQLAPGTHPGRLTIFSENALKTMKEEGLFL